LIEILYFLRYKVICVFLTLTIDCPSQFKLLPLYRLQIKCERTNLQQQKFSFFISLKKHARPSTTRARYPRPLGLLQSSCFKGHDTEEDSVACCSCFFISEGHLQGDKKMLLPRRSIHKKVLPSLAALQGHCTLDVICIGLL
jgi:hypothetical protein